MTLYDYTGPEEFRPITPWGYVGYSLLFSIPFVGLIFVIVFAFSDKNLNRRSFARSYFCSLLIALIVMSILYIVGFSAFGTALFSALVS